MVSCRFVSGRKTPCRGQARQGVGIKREKMCIRDSLCIDLKPTEGKVNLEESYIMRRLRKLTEGA